MDWLEEAKRLPLGHKTRMRHDCSETRDMTVSHGENGYSAYCFRCGNVGFEGFGYQNLAELERLRTLNATAQEVSNELPADLSPSIPAGPARWLFKAGLSVLRAGHRGVGWSERLQRIVLPLYGSDGELLYWQARAVLPGQTPKYINPPIAKADLLYRCIPDDADFSEVVVTEDILSAIRVGLHCPAVSILGTKTSDQQAAQLAKYSRVTYWLDPDEAGQQGNRAGTRKLSLVTDTRVINSDVDPKNLSDRRIRELLGLPPNHRYTVC